MLLVAYLPLARLGHSVRARSNSDGQSCRLLAVLHRPAGMHIRKDFSNFCYKLDNDDDIVNKCINGIDQDYVLFLRLRVSVSQY
jgi:hypothetical protein